MLVMRGGEGNFFLLLKSPLGGGDGGGKNDGGGWGTPAETKISVLLSATVERFGVSRTRDFKNLLLYFQEPCPSPSALPT